MNRGREIFTIGHSTHEWDTFLRLLTRHGITAVADVRSHPFGRLPHFCRDSLAVALERQGIAYVPLGRELGARRDEPECYVDDTAVYERVAQLPRFREGLHRVAAACRRHTLALMCAEREPLDCHRCVLICRHLKPLGLPIRHILANGDTETHADTETRMMRLSKISRQLFDHDTQEADLIEQAYEIRGRQIAYYRADR